MADGSSASGLQDDELYLPRTVVNKLIKEVVPNIRVTNDARDLLLNCCTEFIHLIASEASDISENQQKKVISPEHVVEALNTLGFQEYVADVEAVHKEYKEQASKHRKRGKSKLDRLGIPEEELLRQQQQLFEEARQQQMESELLEHQRAQQQLLQQQASQLQQPPQQPPSQGLPPQPPQQPPSQGLPPQPPQAPTALPTQLTTTPYLQQQHPPHLQSQATASSSSVVDTSLLGMSQPTVAPQAVPTAVRTTVTGLPTTAATMATGVGGGAASGLGGGGLAAALAGGGVSGDTLMKAGMGVHQAQSINTAGLSMLAAVGARQQQEQQLIQQHQQVTTQQSTPAKGPPQLLPNNAAITVASLQATSSLLQQALAMASAQVAASNTAQQQRPPATSAASTAGVGGATGASLPLPQSLLLQQQALAALAAHQVQMGSHLSQQLGQTGKGPFVVPTTSTPPPSTNTGMTPPTSVPVAFGTGANLQGSDNPGGPSPGGGLESGQLDSKVSPPT